MNTTHTVCTCLKAFRVLVTLPTNMLYMLKLLNLIAAKRSTKETGKLMTELMKLIELTESMKSIVVMTRVTMMVILDFRFLQRYRSNVLLSAQVMSY